MEKLLVFLGFSKGIFEALIDGKPLFHAFHSPYYYFYI